MNPVTKPKPTKNKTELASFVLQYEGKSIKGRLPKEELEGWIETFEILAEPGITADLLQGELDYQNGNYITLEDLATKQNG